MKNTIVSIIVPVYNVSRFLSECIKGVLAQSFVDWELILVNDGSTDGSGEICDMFAAADTRIRVIHKPNSGVSDSRNRALDMATGKYILFLDADDFWCSDTFLEEMVRLAEVENLDIVRGEYKEVTESSTDYRNPFWQDKQQLENQCLSSSVFLEKVVAGEYFSCLCLIRMDKVGSLRFEVGRVYMEDADFLVHLLLQRLRCAYSPRVFYAYRKHIGTATAQIGPQQWRDAFLFVETGYSLSRQVEEQRMKTFLKQESSRFFILYFKLMAQSSFSFMQKRKWCRLWYLYTLKKEYQVSIKEWNYWLGQCVSALPLDFLLFYYRYKCLIRKWGRLLLAKCRIIK